MEDGNGSNGHTGWINIRSVLHQLLMIIVSNETSCIETFLRNQAHLLSQDILFHTSSLNMVSMGVAIKVKTEKQQIEAFLAQEDGQLTTLRFLARIHVRDVLKRS